MADEEMKFDINESAQPFVSADEISAPQTEPERENQVFISRLAGLVEERFDAAERGKQDDERRWLNSYHNYRGIYNKNVRFKENEKSKVFIKVTKTKTLAAYGQLVDVVFSGAKFPLQIQETLVPDGISEFAHLNPLKDQMGSPMDVGPELEGNLDYMPGAGITGDNNEVHTNDEYAKNTPFKTRIVHGILVVGIASGLTQRLGIFNRSAMAALDLQWTFKAGVLIGDTIRVRITIENIRETSKGDRGIVTRAYDVLNQRGEVVQTGKLVVMMHKKPS